MKGFIIVNLFFLVFSAVVGGCLFLCLSIVRWFHAPDDLEKGLMLIMGIVSLILAGFVMKQVHSMIERRL